MVKVQKKTAPAAGLKQDKTPKIKVRILQAMLILQKLLINVISVGGSRRARSQEIG